MKDLTKNLEEISPMEEKGDFASKFTDQNKILKDGKIPEWHDIGNTEQMNLQDELSDKLVPPEDAERYVEDEGLSQNIEKPEIGDKLVSNFVEPTEKPMSGAMYLDGSEGISESGDQAAVGSEGKIKSDGPED